jgi:macrolide-specific efflux system membrane fusion protein
MRKNKFTIIAVVIILAAAGAFWFKHSKNSKLNGEVTKEIRPAIGTIENSISTTGSVLPRNRLEVKPPVNGRIEEILVKEGDQVKAGQILVWMSSTERAALLDAAQGGAAEKLAYWKEVYKPIPLMSPIDAEVIVATTQPGQTVTSSDAVIVLSDRLIVRAQVDETDIGKVKVGQQAWISLDAYPETKIKAAVEHIYYESKTVNNVTIYEVDLLPESVPEFFRSGMNATIIFITARKENVLTLPEEAIIRQNGGSLVFVKDNSSAEAVQRQVQLGISDDKNSEIVSGLSENDIVVVKSKKYMLPQSSTSGTNPFLPARPGRSQQQRTQQR